MSSLELSSRTLDNGFPMANDPCDGDAVATTFAGTTRNLVAMLPPLDPRATADVKALDAAAHLLSPTIRVREPALTVVHARSSSLRLEVYEVPPLAGALDDDTDDDDIAAAEAARAVHCTVATRTLGCQQSSPPR